MTSNEVVIVSAVRTAVGKAPRGTLRTTRPDDLAAVRRSRGRWRGCRSWTRTEIEDVILGCAMPEAEQGMNVARIASFRAGLPVTTSGMTINRFCSSGLQSISIGGGPDSEWGERRDGGGGDGEHVVCAFGGAEGERESRGWGSTIRGATFRWG